MRKRTKFAVNTRSQLVIPVIALALLVVFNLLRDPGFFTITLNQNNLGNTVLAGNLISVLNGASELAILALGMTLVTAASGGQDISVGAAAAIAGSVFIRVLKAGGGVTPTVLAAAFLAGCVVAMLFGAFNGALVAFFKIQPMIATLILFNTGRAIAYWINGGATPTVSSQLLSYCGGFIPGIPAPTPVFVVVACGVLVALALKYTNLGLYSQAVGINEKSARLNGINVVFMKLLAYVILGFFVAVAAALSVSRLGMMNNETFLLNIEMDAILAVAIGGNALGGGKFSMIGSVLGAYIIQGLTTTLYAMQVPSSDVRAYKAVVIVVLVTLASPVVKEKAGALWGRLFANRRASGVTGDMP